MVVELLHGGGEIGGGLILDEALSVAARVAIASDLTVHDVETGLTSEVLQVLREC